jgi:pilus assembly protein CpaB
MKRSVLAVAIASVLALAGCAMIWFYVRGADARVMAGKEAARVLIATKRIPAGTTGAEVKSGGYVEPVTLPKSSIPADSLEAVDASLESLAVTADIQPRQLLLRGAFAAQTEVSGGLNIPEGKIAVTVPLIVTEGTAFLQPGTKVAVFNTYGSRAAANGTPNGVPMGDKQAAGEAADHATKLLLPSVEVVAVGAPGEAAQTNGSSGSTKDEGSGGMLNGNSDAKSKSAGDASAATLVTLAVTQDEAERLIHAQQTGALYIALLDGSSTLRAGPGVNDYTLFN